MPGYNSFQGYNVFSAGGVSEVAIGFSVKKPLFSISASVTIPFNSSILSFEVSKPVFSIGASVTTPQPVSLVSFNVKKPFFNISAYVTGNVIVVSGDAKYSLPHISNKIIL